VPGAVGADGGPPQKLVTRDSAGPVFLPLSGLAESHLQRRNDLDHLEAVGKFYSLMQEPRRRGIRGLLARRRLHRIAKTALVTAPSGDSPMERSERARWRAWATATQRGHRVKTSVFRTRFAAGPLIDQEREFLNDEEMQVLVDQLEGGNDA